MKHEIGQLRGFDRRKAEQTRTVPFVFSTGEVDRHGTRLNMNNWSLHNFNRNGVALYSHDMGDEDPDKVIGSARAWVEDGKLLGEITFEPADVNPLADKIFRKVLLKTLKAVSVGFIETERGHYDSDKIYNYGGQELLEISVVSIPSNPSALTRRKFKSDEQCREWMKRRARYLKLNS